MEHFYLYFRLVHSGRQMNATTGADILTFGTRSGTRNGVETHIFRVETQRDLAHWSRALVQGSHGAAMLVKEVTCRKYCIKWGSKRVFFWGGGGKQRRRPACASAQTDQYLCYSLFVKYYISTCFKRNSNFLAILCS